MRAARPTTIRKLFAVGRLGRCVNGSHVGPLVDAARFSEAGGMWEGCGNCEKCRSTIHASQLRKVA